MTGASGAEYGALELALRERGEELNIPLAVKLASQVRELDRRYGLGEMYIPSRRRRAAGTLEDAWEAVFQVKKAEQPEQVHIMGREEPLDKAAIVSRYGAGALEIVERKDVSRSDQYVRGGSSTVAQAAWRQDSSYRARLHCVSTAERSGRGQFRAR